MSPLPPILQQSQNENLQPPEITSIPAPDPRLEPVLQPLRLQIQESAPKPPPREQPSTYPSLNLISLIKIYINIRRYPRFSKPGKHKRHPSKFNTVNAVPRATLGQISASKQHSILFPTIYSNYCMLYTCTIIRVKRKQYTTH